MSEDTRRQRALSWVKFGLSIGLSALFLWLTFASLGGCPEGLSCVKGACVAPGDDPAVACGTAEEGQVCASCVDWANLPAQLADVSLGSLLFFVLVYAVVHVLRIWRWYYMLRPLGLRRLWPAVNAGAIGLAAVVIVPLRLGELVRPYVIARETDVPMSAALGTAVVERVVDGLVVTGLLFVMLLTLETRADSPAAVWTAGTISAVVFVATSVVLVFAWARRGPTLRVLESIGNRVSRGLTVKALGLLEGFLDGVATLWRSGRDLGGFTLTTLAYWVLNAASTAWLAQAFGLELGFLEALAVMSILVIGIMVPGAPGHIGTYEYFFQAGLALFVAVDAQPQRVVAYIATIHVLQFLVQVGFGAPFLLASGISLRRAIAATEEEGAAGLTSGPEAAGEGEGG